MLLYVVAVPKGNHHESRGQIIASGYLFGMKEADELYESSGVYFRVRIL